MAMEDEDLKAVREALQQMGWGGSWYDQKGKRLRSARTFSSDCDHWNPHGDFVYRLGLY